jgi:hypothetical protein
MINFRYLAVISMSIFALSACGGGDGKATDSIALATDAYKGSWAGHCGYMSENNIVEQSIDNVTGATSFFIPLYSVKTVTTTANTANSVTFVAIHKYYSSRDTNCSGSVVMTQTFSPLTITFDGTTASNGLILDNVRASSGNQIYSVVSGSSTVISGLGTEPMTINGYEIPAGFFIDNALFAWPISSLDTSKRYMRTTASQMFWYDTSPSTVDSLVIFNKI